MQRRAADLRELVEAVEVQSSTVFSIESERFDASGLTGGTVDLTATIASALYFAEILPPNPDLGHAGGVGSHAWPAYLSISCRSQTRGREHGSAAGGCMRLKRMAPWSFIASMTT